MLPFIIILICLFYIENETYRNILIIVAIIMLFSYLYNYMMGPVILPQAEIVDFSLITVPNSDIMLYCKSPMLIHGGKVDDGNCSIILKSNSEGELDFSLVKSSISELYLDDIVVNYGVVDENGKVNNVVSEQIFASEYVPPVSDESEQNIIEPHKVKEVMNDKFEHDFEEKSYDEKCLNDYYGPKSSHYQRPLTDALKDRDFAFTQDQKPTYDDNMCENSDYENSFR